MSHQNLHVLEVVLMVGPLVFRWPKPSFFMVLGAHGDYTTTHVAIIINHYEDPY